ncbi:TERF1-interacting nuclear factor 2 TRF1-interacting nuclear protein 2 [Channa argus]|uniref:TERF1-interacting nuclear factor 2 TRF1-interacting nuclear protein 2 n=1 Tax=Channa argus TaxID=215402 RepID=A0A6G1PG30_CHAAH|nr:TERF1-interacting nuclear factor 2 TRF1-interacting nuclear protein 2 [Channa argus]KAK2918290.1 hypothetical protein Q8A73_005036 [Channa argus]
MEARDLQAVNKRLQSFPKLPLWIIEHVWAHKMMDIQEVLDPSYWPDVDSQPLSLEDSWRLRVTSAQIYSIVKNRDMENFEKVMRFLETTYRLLPRLVAPVKHMKIMFGLKTMVIMWMLREGRGMVDTVFKIIHFFPSKLPQYQDHCSQHEMFIMRKNHLDFKTLAQALAMDKVKLEDYIKKDMEKHYGEHYAQKLEERLLQYLHKLEAVLPRDTYIDKIMKKSSPVTEEEKLLLEVITCDSTAIATTLKKLLHCDFASFCQTRVSQSSKNGSSSKTVPKPVEGDCPLGSQPEVFWGIEEAAQKVSEGVPVMLENGRSSDAMGHRQTKGGGDAAKRGEEKNCDRGKEDIGECSTVCVQDPAPSPQFCSKHQRWVKSILQECPDECSQELQLQASVSLSPLLFQSSASTSSSQDLTPSDLIPCLPDQQPSPSQNTTQLQTPVQASQQTNLENKHSSRSASDTSQTEPVPQPSAPRDTLLPALWSPVVRLIDIISVRKSCPNFKSDHFTMSKNKLGASSSSPQVLISPHYCTSGNKDSIFSQLEGVAPSNVRNILQTAPVSQDASNLDSCQPATLRTFSRLSRKFRRTCTTHRHSQTLDGFNQQPLTEQGSKAPTNIRMSNLPLYTKSSQRVVPQNSTNHKLDLQTQNANAFESNTIPCSTVVSSCSNSSCLVRLDNRMSTQQSTENIIWLSSRSQLRLSMQSQDVLLQSTLLQPYVSLNRLSTQKCYRMTEGRCLARCVVPVLQGSNDEEKDADSSFDPNTLYSSHSSNSDSEDPTDYDPDYKPGIPNKRLFLEYETVRSCSS